MKTENQRKLLFVPYLNLLPFVIFWRRTAQKCNTNTTKHMLKSGILCVAAVLIIVVPIWLLLAAIQSEVWNGILNFLSHYLSGIAVGYICVTDQEQMLREHEENKW